MPISQQSISRINIKKLKSIRDLELSFNGHPVTGILGPNGNGKSTILHTLACAFQPNGGGEDYKFSNFFLPHPDALWQGSYLTITHSYREGSQEHIDVERVYEKKITSDRWTPRYVNRPKRDIYYIGIDKCVPLIESEKKQVKINYSTSRVTEDIIRQVLEKASYVLNRRYSTYNIHDAGSGKKFIGVEVDGLRYSALSMSAGEQKVFLILEKVFRAPKYSLILIDEIDLLLHDLALKRLINVVSERATDKNLQIVFTTHRESILDLSDQINIRHLINTPDKTLCFNDTKPDAINRLTGKQPRPLEIFVEDDLSSTIVNKVAAKLRIHRHLTTERFGAAINCFTTVGGLLLSGEVCDKSLFVLDGDVYNTTEERKEKLSRIITGDDQRALNLREKALSKICQFNLPDGISPEKYLHGIVSSMGESDNEELNEIIEVAKGIMSADNDHKYIDDIIERLGWERSTGLSKIIDLVCTSDEWDNYVSGVHGWLSSFVDEVRENSA